MHWVYRSSDFNVGTVGPVACIAANGTMTAQHAGGLSQAYAALAASHGCFVAITVTTAKRPAISDEARASLAAIARQFREQDLGTAVVLAQPGFGATMVRAIVGGISILVGGNIKVFGDLDGGLGFLQELLAKEAVDGFDAAGIKAALVELKPAEPAPSDVS